MRKSKQMKKIMNKLLMKNKKGIAGMDLAKAFVIGILTLAVLFMLVIIVMNAMNTQAIQQATGNNSTVIVNYVTTGILGLAGQFPTLFTILGVVMLVLLIVVIIVVMNKFSGGNTTELSA